MSAKAFSWDTQGINDMQYQPIGLEVMGYIILSYYRLWYICTSEVVGFLNKWRFASLSAHIRKTSVRCTFALCLWSDQRTFGRQNNILIAALRDSGKVSALASEEHDEALWLCDDGPYVVVFDPLDGSRNIDASIPTGKQNAFFFSPNCDWSRLWNIRLAFSSLSWSRSYEEADVLLLAFTCTGQIWHGVLT